MIYAAIAVLAFLIASYTDLKSRDAPEILTTGLILTGLFLHGWEAIVISSVSPIISSAYMTVLAFSFAFLLYKIGAWAGGDVKLFTGLGAILPAYGSLDYFPFLVFAASFIAVLPFIIAYLGYFFVAERNLRRLIKPVLFTDLKRAVFSSAFLVAAYELVAALGAHWLFIAPIVYVFYKFKLLSMPLVIVLMAVYLFYDSSAFLTYFASLTSLSFVLFFGIHAFKIAQENILRKTVKAKDLGEGMIPAEDVYIGGTRIADSKLARGLLLNEIKKIKKVRTEMKIKLSIPFVPVITLGLIILLILEKVIK